MATTHCLRVAQFVPMATPLVGDAPQVTQVNPLRTRWNPMAPGGVNFPPIPTREGDVMQADASLAWVAVPIDGGT
jgi:hypothetical protein